MRILKSLIVFIYSIYIIASVSAYENKNNGGWGSLWGENNDNQIGWNQHHGGGGGPHGPHGPHGGSGFIHHGGKPHHTFKPIIKDPCYNVYCPKGWQCKAGDDGKANCVEVIETCNNVHCPRNQHCEIINKKAQCVNDPFKGDCDPCRDLICPDNYQCLAQPKEGWFIKHLKHHWQLHPSHCGNNPNRIKAICVKSPVGTCDKVRCPPGYKCKLYENGPSCEKIQKPHCLTCKEMHCEQNGLVCVLTPVSKRKIFLDPECCPIVPICISPNTISASTIATSGSAYGTTIASLVTGGPPSIGGGSGSIDSSESNESSEDPSITTGDISSEEDSSDFITTDELTTDILDTGDITDELTTDILDTGDITDELTTDILDTGDFTDFITTDDTGDLTDYVTTDYLDTGDITDYITGDITDYITGDITGLSSSSQETTDDITSFPEPTYPAQD